MQTITNAQALAHLQTLGCNTQLAQAALTEYHGNAPLTQQLAVQYFCNFVSFSNTYLTSNGAVIFDGQPYNYQAGWAEIVNQ